MITFKVLFLVNGNYSFVAKQNKGQAINPPSPTGFFFWGCRVPAGDEGQWPQAGISWKTEIMGAEKEGKICENDNTITLQVS